MRERERGGKRILCEIVPALDFSCRTVQRELSRGVVNPESPEVESATENVFFKKKILLIHNLDNYIPIFTEENEISHLTKNYK